MDVQNKDDGAWSPYIAGGLSGLVIICSFCRNAWQSF